MNKTKYIQILQAINIQTKNIEDYGKKYSATFPADIRKGLVSFTADTKELATDYYFYISAVANALSVISQMVSKLKPGRCFSS